MLWNSVQQFGVMFISFAVNILLARLLTPEDFGIIGMIMVFIALSEVFVDGGFASALIQKKAPTNADYSTVFYWNLFISLLLFILLFITAPFIERFYEMSNLTLILRVQGIILIINAFNIIQFNQLRKKLRFRELANVALIATLIGAIIGVIMAYLGYGVWSLVVKLLATSFFTTVFLWLKSKWIPSLVFSKRSFKDLFGYGAFILLTSLVDKIYNNIQQLIIGKVFSAGDLGYFTQAKKMEDIPVRGLSAVVNQVTFPVFSELQDDIERMKRGISKSLKAITFINFPMMVLLIVIAEPLILILLTDKWEASIPYFQILCIAGMIWTVLTTNTNIFKALGRSDMYFYVQFGKRVVGVLTILIGLRFGIFGMLYAVAINAYLFFFINAYYSSKLTGYRIMHQIKDIGPQYILAVFVGIITHFVGTYMSVNVYVDLVILSLVYLILYLGLALLFKIEGCKTFLDIILSKVKLK